MNANSRSSVRQSKISKRWVKKPALAPKLAKEAGVPTACRGRFRAVPGQLRGRSRSEASAKEIGYPVILKAAAGGGGRGIHVVYYSPRKIYPALLIAASVGSRGRLRRWFPRCMSRNSASFLVTSRFKFCAIKYGQSRVSWANAIAPFSDAIKSCSKKLPISDAMMPETSRRKWSEAALKLCEARSSYENASERSSFSSTKTEELYFIEMNTRIQVEHPVTEMVTGFDLIKEQIQIAAARKTRFSPEDKAVRRQRSHSTSIECRINAEDPG